MSTDCISFGGRLKYLGAMGVSNLGSQKVLLRVCLLPPVRFSPKHHQWPTTPTTGSAVAVPPFLLPSLPGVFLLTQISLISKATAVSKELSPSLRFHDTSQKSSHLALVTDWAWICLKGMNPELRKSCLPQSTRKKEVDRSHSCMGEEDLDADSWAPCSCGHWNPWLQCLGPHWAWASPAPCCIFPSSSTFCYTFQALFSFSSTSLLIYFSTSPTLSSLSSGCGRLLKLSCCPWICSLILVFFFKLFLKFQ